MSRPGSAVWLGLTRMRRACAEATERHMHDAIRRMACGPGRGPGAALTGCILGFVSARAGYRCRQSARGGGPCFS